MPAFGILEGKTFSSDTKHDKLKYNGIQDKRECVITENQTVPKCIMIFEEISEASVSVLFLLISGRYRGI